MDLASCLAPVVVPSVTRCLLAEIQQGNLSIDVSPNILPTEFWRDPWVSSLWVCGLLMILEGACALGYAMFWLVARRLPWFNSGTIHVWLFIVLRAHRTHLSDTSFSLSGAAPRKKSRCASTCRAATANLADHVPCRVACGVCGGGARLRERRLHLRRAWVGAKVGVVPRTFEAAWLGRAEAPGFRIVARTPCGSAECVVVLVAFAARSTHNRRARPVLDM